MTLVVLYGGQYLAAGLIVALPALLRERGASLDQVGAISLVTFGTIAKVLWAPLVDRRREAGARRGHYRMWLLLVQPAIALTLLAMVPLDIGTQFTALFVATCVLAALIGTQDIATDALTVRLTTHAGRAAANAVQVGAGFGGAIVGTTGTLVIVQHWGWGWAMVALSGVSLVPMIAAYRLVEPAATKTERRPRVADVLSLPRRPGVAAWMGLVVPLTWSGIILPQSLLAPMLIDGGWRLDQLGLLTSVLTGVAGIAGAAMAGGIVGRYGRKPALVAAAAVQLVATAGLFPLANTALAVATVAALGVARGVTNTIIFTVCMDLCRENTEGSDFTLLGSWGYGIAVGASALGPVLAGRLGYPATIAIALGLSAAALVAICVTFPNSGR
ncbi:MFS transporter [Pseudonocardia acaciae]|uniref:MFS transporter n=1 Tax=Pseudonocardia acaciae TaxID=551276 RepID=UPI001470413D|nr:MFS transporter [Pseudonocardia acaciae]